MNYRIIFWGLVFRLAVVSADCNVVTLKLKHFDWNKVGIILLTNFLLKAAVKIATWFNPLKTKRRPLYLKTQFLPRCKFFSSRL